MKIITALLFITVLTVAITSTAWLLASPEKVNTNQLSPVHQALYGAMRAGYTVGKAGGKEQDMDQVFNALKSGNTNAVQEWLNIQTMIHFGVGK